MAIYSQPSLRQPESISPEFYFSSQAFITKAQADINQLLNTWQDSVRSLPPHKKVLGPFLKFKSIYTRLGWIYIHLSVVDPALRKHWFSTLSRLLINQLNQPNQPLKQIGALFTLWALWGTQPESSVLGPKQYIIIDPKTDQYLNSLPSQLSEQLDRYFKDSIDESFEQPAKNTTLNRQLHHNHHHHPYHHHQNSSSSSSTSLTIKHRAHLDPNIFGTSSTNNQPSDSIHQIYITPNPQPPPITSHHNLDRITETVLKTKDEFQKWKIEQDQSLCDPTELNRLRTSYLSTKSFLNQPTASTSTSSGLGLMVGNNNSDGGAEDPLTKELFIEAIGMTRKVIQKTGPGLDHLLFPEPHSSSKSNTTISSTGVNLKSKNSKKNKKNSVVVGKQAQDHQITSLDAFFLVDHSTSVPDLLSK
ncbi:hypothetical protein PSHT_14736 [Puccinia striiformis]|uniref:Uncharacterized protein n=1 Tax=Puccinia striiformis TaxID=27350 RepID=A0A2S4UIJ1_9BASI|nr:hypothetical protein PSHT_14736 [Puccinia striiformis]